MCGEVDMYVGGGVGEGAELDFGQLIRLWPSLFAGLWPIRPWPKLVFQFFGWFWWSGSCVRRRESSGCPVVRQD